MPKLKLESSDKKVFSVDVEVAKKSITLRDLMANFDIEETGDEDGDPIPLPKVDAANLEKLLHWAEKHKDDPPAPTDDETKYRTDNISDFDKAFFNTDQAALLQLIHAANFMDMPDLLLTACKTVANIIKERTVDQIRDYFLIKNDFTEEQEEYVKHVFGDIMMMVGLESLDTLHTCRQVCQSWNEMIVSNEILQPVS